MKKLFLFFVVLVLIPSFAYAEADFSYREGASLGKKKAWGTFYLRDNIIMDGSTVDAYETTFGIEDPTADRTITFPDYTGGVPLVIGQSATATVQTGVGSDDVTGSSVAIPAGWMTAGKTIRWTIAGTRAGLGSIKVHLQTYTTGNTATTVTVMTLEPSPDADGDFMVVFTMHEYTGTANQVITGHSISDNSNGTSPFQVTAKTYDMSAARTFDVKIESINPGDTITTKHVLVETFTK